MLECRGGDNFTKGEDAEAFLYTLRNYSQQDAPGHAYQQVAKFSQYGRTDQTMGRYLLKFDVLQREAAARVIMGWPFPDVFASILCMRNASLSRTEKSLLLASV